MTTAFRQALHQGIPQLGLCMMYPAPGIVERIGGDWDWIWIDGQHGQLGYADTLAMVRACNLVGRPAFVRVPGPEFGHIGLALDTGAEGLIVPLVESADEARRVVQAAKFPPLGSRSYGGRRPIDRLGRGYSDTANEDVLLVVQVESPGAVAQAEAIAAVPGVQGLFIGPDDLMLRRGGWSMTATLTPDAIRADLQTVGDACRRHGKVACMVAVSPEMQTLCLDLGYRMIVGGGDVSFLAGSSKKASAEARARLQHAARPNAAATGAGTPRG